MLRNFIRKYISCFLAVTVFWTSVDAGHTAELSLVPSPGQAVDLSPVARPPILKGLKVSSTDPFHFDFLVDLGLSSADPDKKQVERLVKYFLTALTVPQKDQWVNLSPLEPDRIAAKTFADTEMSRELLGQDYLLKQLTASLLNPESTAGQRFWDKVYRETYKRFGTTDVPTDTFHKVWILPDHATVFAQGQRVVITESRLRVMLESDYKALGNGAVSASVDAMGGEKRTAAQKLADDILREVVVPIISEEVNSGESFAPLRQIYSGMILAKWFKDHLRKSLLGTVYVEQNKTAGVDQKDKTANEQIYQQYLEAYRKGTTNLIHEDIDPASGELVPRKYFSGGVDATNLEVAEDDTNLAQIPHAVQAACDLKVLSPDQDGAMLSKEDLEQAIFNSQTEIRDRYTFMQTLSGINMPWPEKKALVIDVLSRVQKDQLAAASAVAEFLSIFRDRAAEYINEIVNVLNHKGKENYRILESIANLGFLIDDRSSFESISNALFELRAKLPVSHGTVFSRTIPQLSRYRYGSDKAIETKEDLFYFLQLVEKYAPFLPGEELFPYSGLSVATGFGFSWLKTHENEFFALVPHLPEDQGSAIGRIVQLKNQLGDDKFDEYFPLLIKAAETLGPGFLKLVSLSFDRKYMYRYSFDDVDFVALRSGLGDDIDKLWPVMMAADEKSYPLWVKMGRALRLNTPRNKWFEIPWRLTEASKFRSEISALLFQYPFTDIDNLADEIVSSLERDLIKSGQDLLSGDDQLKELFQEKSRSIARLLPPDSKMDAVRSALGPDGFSELYSAVLRDGSPVNAQRLRRLLSFGPALKMPQYTDYTAFLIDTTVDFRLRMATVSVYAEILQSEAELNGNQEETEQKVSDSAGQDPLLKEAKQRLEETRSSFNAMLKARPVRRKDVETMEQRLSSLRKAILEYFLGEKLPAKVEPLFNTSFSTEVNAIISIVNRLKHNEQGDRLKEIIRYAFTTFFKSYLETKDAEKARQKLTESLMNMDETLLKAIDPKAGQDTSSPVDIPLNKTARQELVDAGYSPSLWKEGVEIKWRLQTGLSAEEKAQQIRQAAYEMVEIAHASRIYSIDGEYISLEKTPDKITTAEAAESFLRAIQKTEGEDAPVRLAQIVEEIRTMEAANISNGSEQNIQVRLKKDFFAEAAAGVGVPGCFAPDGIHNEAFPMYASQSTVMTMQVFNENGRQLANAVVMLGKEGAYVEPSYNGSAYNVEPAYAAVIARLSRLVPKIVLSPSSAGYEFFSKHLKNSPKKETIQKVDTVFPYLYHDTGHAQEHVRTVDVENPLIITAEILKSAGIFDLLTQEAHQKRPVLDRSISGAIYQFLTGQSKTHYLPVIGDVNRMLMREGVLRVNSEAYDEFSNAARAKIGDHFNSQEAESVFDGILDTVERFQWPMEVLTPVDAAMAPSGPQSPGGIDLNQDFLNLQTLGEDVPLYQRSFASGTVQGFMPVITAITPLSSTEEFLKGI